MARNERSEWQSLRGAFTEKYINNPNIARRMNPFTKINKNLQERMNITRACKDLRKNLDSKGYCIWNAKQNDPQYKLQIVLNWSPQMGTEEIWDEARKVLDICKKVAADYGLEKLVSEPFLATGGVYTVLAGFKKA